MGGPVWLAGLVAVVTLVITAYCLARLVAGRVQKRPASADVDAAHAIMGVGMAAMLVPSLSPVPAVTWAWVFAVVSVWLAGRTARAFRLGPQGRLVQAHYAPHLVMSVAMVYMGAAASGGSAGGGVGMSGPAAAAGFPPLTLLFALFMSGYAVWLLDRLPGIPTVRAWRAAPPFALAPAGAPAPVARAVPLSPRLEVGCHIAMAVAMAYMLILMV